MSVGWRIFLGIFYQLIKRSVLPIASSGFSLKIDSEAVVQSGHWKKLLSHWGDFFQFLLTAHIFSFLHKECYRIMPEVKQYNVVVGNDLITIETGKIANLANGSVTIRQGDTLLLVTATMSKNPPPNLDYFPLSVEYEERIYAVGKIPGSFFRREGRPSEAAILVGRLTDRPLRPLFPDNFFNEVQIVSTVLSVDELVQPDILSIIGASAALTISDIPFGAPPYDGPVGAVRIGLIDDQFVVNPTFPQMEQSTLNLRVAGTRDAILMVECGANEVPEETIEAALVFAHQAMQPLIDVQELMAQEIGKPKIVVPAKADDSELRAAVQALALDKVANALRTTTSKEMRSAALDAITATVLEAYAEKTDVCAS
jgi:polyribonucleotide nucleotidyltransferase